MATLSAVSNMLKKEGSDLTMNDIVIVSDIVSVMGPSLSENEMKAISVLSKKPKEDDGSQLDEFQKLVPSNPESDSMTTKEAAKIVEMVESMGPVIERKEKVKI